ncbi:hypothetical protein BDP27DRAFT_1419636 [Rhodocollybia butyracea]|uniref:Uncharacterized protein n=1 Tax=Rhodocollybia butyracea TaxID=206335 RepID=A0A9P5PRH0_9AGAR|nr:hypothetical protein BDP27DRAFT_1419636 [Rhodocollybia butyracea]
MTTSVSPKRSRSPSPSRDSREHHHSPKRTRDESTAPDLSKNDDHYVLDPEFSSIKGDIYLTIGNTLFPCLLKELQSVNGLFADLFSMQQPEDAELIHGLPHCPMFNCSARELRSLLQHINGSKPLLKKPRPSSKDRPVFNLENILHVIKLSTRFDLPGCRDDAIECLDNFFTIMWQHIFTSTQTSFPHQPEFPPVSIAGCSIGEDADPILGLSIQMINVFQECELFFYLPYAYYFASQQGQRELVAGAKLPDGTVEKLSQGDLIVVLEGRDSLRHLRRVTTFGWLTQYVNDHYDYPSLHGCTGELPGTEQTCHSFMRKVHSLLFGLGSPVLENRCDALDTVPFAARDVMRSQIR